MKLPKETAELLETYFAGDPTPEVIQAMEAWLRKDKANARILAEYGLVDRLIAHEQKNQDASAIFASLLEAEDHAEPDFSLLHMPAFAAKPSKSQEKPITFRDLCLVAGYLASKTLRTKAAVYTSIAAVLLIGTALYLAIFGLGTSPDSPNIANNTPPNKPAESAKPITRDQPVATLTNTHNAQWSGRPASAGTEHPPTTGTKLHSNDRLTLTHGFAEITTARGAIAILEAPATIELLDHNNALHLHTGKLVGLCHTESSKGFVVKTDYCTVTDIGTEFGVTATPNNVEATVFVGEIAVQTPNMQTTVLTRHQTARLSIGIDGPTLVVENQIAQGYTRWQPRPAVITSATLNDKRFKLEIAAQGIYEDALIYSDRDYQINGLDAEGLPAALLGGDLIRMPADARTGRTADIGELRVEVELSERCDIYLIAAPNHGGLDWIKRDYELTSMRVGLDASDSFFREQNPLGLGVGPGQSIDETYHVWKRKQPATARVTFGPAHDQSMYSIVAVPTDNDAN